MNKFNRVNKFILVSIVIFLTVYYYILDKPYNDIIFWGTCGYSFLSCIILIIYYIKNKKK